MRLCTFGHCDSGIKILYVDHIYMCVYIVFHTRHLTNEFGRANKFILYMTDIL